MSGNLIFSKTSDRFYNLIFNYDTLLASGETIRDYNVYVNDDHASGLYTDRLETYSDAVSGNYNTIFTRDPDICDNANIAVLVNSGIVDTIYSIQMDAITNRRNILTKTIDVTIDELAYSDIYDRFEYRFLVDDDDIYILPASYYSGESYVSSLAYNTEYGVNISNAIYSENNLKLVSSENFTFTSQYCPLFTTATRIILMLGVEGDKFAVDTINRYIHRNSLEAIDLMNVSPDCSAAKIGYDYYGCGPDGIPSNIRRYVECKTAYDLFNLLDRMRQVDGNGGGQTKTLGDMSIKYNGGGGGDGSSVDPKKDLYDCFMGLQGILSNSPTVCGTGAGINNAVRGRYDVSKGFSHPVDDITHNRVVNTRPDANGPWFQNGNTRYPRSNF